MTNSNTENKKVQQCNKLVIPDNAMVTYVQQGKHFAEVRYMERPVQVNVKKLSGSEYLDLNTGEIKEYEYSDHRSEKNWHKTFDMLRGLIRHNFDSEATNQKMLTLTYTENVTDPEQAYKDFEHFIKRMRRHFKTHKLDYIAVIEPQERGAWHYHILLKSDKPILYIDYTWLYEAWGHGRVHSESLVGDDVGSYYVAYFTNAEGTAGDGTKRGKKGSRLHMYPKGMKFYRCSKGIKRPVEQKLPYSEVRKAFGLDPVYTRSYDVVDESGNIVNRIQREVFKR